jgi:hypothetical protein
MPIVDSIQKYAISNNLLPLEPSRCAEKAAKTSTVKGDVVFPLDGAQAKQQTAQSGMAEAESRQPASAGGLRINSTGTLKGYPEVF